MNGLATGSVKVLFDPDPRNPWDEASDFKRKVEWPNQNEVDGTIGIASGSKGLTDTLKDGFKQLSQLAGNVKNVQQKIESVKKLKDQGAKALLPMVMQQVAGSTGVANLGQPFGGGGFVASSNQSNPLRALTQSSQPNISNNITSNIQSPFKTFL